MRPLACAGVLFLLAVATSDGQGPALDEPLPLQRVVIPLSRLPAELERTRQGVLVQLPRDDFEALVRRAAKADQSARSAPRLLKATYAAELAGNALVHGSGQWLVHHPAQTPSVLPLPGFNPALAKVRWAGGGDAILGDLDGKNLGLFVDRPGEVFFDWSLRGAVVAGGVQFDLRLPPCPVASLELRVPADCQVIVPKNGALLSGPHEAEQPGMHIWVLQFSGRSQVELLVRQPAEAQPAPPLLFSQVQTKVQVRPEKLLADYDFQVEVLHTSLSELAFECDPTLQPYEVSARNADIKSWDFRESPAAEPAGKKGDQARKPSTLVVRLREPVQGTIQGLKIRCLGARPADKPAAAKSAAKGPDKGPDKGPMDKTATDKPWTCPALRLAHGRSRAEALKIHIHPDVQLEAWDPGGFRLLSSTTDADDAQVISLVDPAAGVEPSRRPTGVFVTQGHELFTRQRTWWQLGPQGTTLATEIAYELARGNLFQLAVKLPTGQRWRVEAVELEPKDALRSWAVQGPLLLVDLQRGLNARHPVKLTMRLSARAEGATAASGPRLHDIPTLEPVEAASRRGMLAVSVDPTYQVALQKVSAPLAPPEQDGPWGAETPQFFFQFRNKALTGQLRLFPQKARVRVRSHALVTLGRGNGSVQARLDLEPVLGNPETLDLAIASGNKTHWKAAGTIVHSLERQPLAEALPCLLSLGAGHSLGHAALDAQLPRAQRWRLRLTGPLTRRETLTLHADLEPRPAGVADQPGARDWDIPLIAVLGAERLDAEVHLQPAGVEMTRIDAAGMEDAAPGSGRRALPGDVGRAFRYGPSYRGRLPHLSVTTRPHTAAAAEHDWCDQAHLITYVDVGDHLLHCFRFHAWNWRQRELAVQLPFGTHKVLAAKVDGRWLEQLPQVEGPEGVTVTLPVGLDAVGHRFEVYYATPAAWSGWPTWASLEAPVPRLPGVPPALRRTWRLAPGLTPLHQDDIRALSDVPGLAQDVRRAWHLGDAALAELVPVLGDDNLETQRLVLVGAESALRRKLTRDMTLADALDRLAHEFLKDQVALVVDRAALRLADVRPDTPLAAVFAAPGGSARPFWESLGLVYVPFPSGPVLTTRQRLETWAQVYGRDVEIRAALDPAVAEAIARGHDARGRFAALGHWLRHEKNLDPAPVALFLPATEGWTTWDPRPGAADAARLVVMQTSSLRSLGIFAALLSCLLAWLIGRRLATVWQFRLGTVWLAAHGLALVWLPVAWQALLWWPLVAAVVFGGVWLGRGLWSAGAAPARASKSTEKAIKLVIGSSTALLLFVGGAYLARGQGQVPAAAADAHLVLLVEPTPGRQVALVSPDLIKKLEDVERKAASPAGAVLTSARYRGEWKGNLGEFTAEFELYSFADKAKLLVPLTGVELKEGSYLDGAPVFPVAPPSPKSGYVVPIRGKGVHRLALSFTVRPAPTGEYQELRFGIPKSSQCRLVFTTATPVQGLQLVGGFGAHDIASAGKARKLTAQLGRDSAVQVRWRLNNPPPPVASAADVREAYFWDLRPGAATLFASLQFLPVKGALTRLSVALPDDIDVRSVEASSGLASAPSLVKSWSLAGKGAERQLHVELTGPAAGRVVLHANLAPRFNLGAGQVGAGQGGAGQVFMRLPVPQKAKQTESFLAYRLDGWETAAKTQNLGVTAVGPDVFAKAWAASGQKDPGAATQAYSFRRTANNAGLLLGLSVPKAQARVEAAWQLYPQHADLTARVRLTGTLEEFSQVELTIPPGVVLAEVRGPQVHHWSRQDARVRIWLHGPRKQADLELAGWTTLAQKVVGAKPGRFVLPVVGVTGAAVVANQVKVTPALGLTLETEKVRNLAKSGDAFDVQALPYEGTFLVKPLPDRPQVRVLTTAEVRNQACILTGHFHCLAPLGKPETFQVVLRHCPSDEVRLEFAAAAESGGAPRVQQRRAGADHVWDVTFPAAAPQPLTFLVKARLPFKDSARFILPEVTAEGVTLVERWVALTGPELRVESQRGLGPVKDAARALRFWPGAARHVQQDGAAWHVKDQDWSMTLAARASAQSAPVTMLLAEEHAFVADGRRWVHQADFLLAGRGDADVQLVLPEQARLLALTVDDRPVAPRALAAPAGAESYWVPLTGPPGPHLVRLRWRYLPEAEGLDRPRLGGVFLAGVQATPMHGRLLVPPGFSLDNPPRDIAASQAQHLLERARAYVTLSRFLAAQPPGETGETGAALLAAQKRFWGHLRHAELQVGYLATSEEKAAFASALAEVRKDYERWLREHSLDNLRLQTDRQPGSAAAAFFVLPEQGTPVFWRLSDMERATTVRLTDHAGADGAWERHRAEFLVLIALSLITLSFLPRGLGYVRGLWPELCLLLALAGTLALGPSSVALLLAAVGLAGRLFWAIRLARRLVLSFFEPKPQAAG